MSDSHIDWWEKPRRISVVIDNPSWILPYGERLVAEIGNGGDNAILCRHHHEIPEGDVAFYLGCIRITPPEILARNRRNLIVHESDLSKERVFSPLTWQVLEGRNEIPVCLLDAANEADAWAVVYRDSMSFEGHELITEMREIQGLKTIELCKRFLDEDCPPKGTPQDGAPIWSSRRRPPDSRLSPDQTIARQFDQLRVSDNYRYPAFFEHRGHRYKVHIEKMRLDPAEWADEYEDAVSIQLHDGGKMAPGGMKFSEKLADQGEVRLRPAVEEDGLLLHKWQSYKFTRLYSRHPSKPTLDEHWKWFHECLHDPERHLNIILYNDERAGALRLDRVSDGIFEISILVSPEFYNMGIATAALKLIRRIWPKSTFRAEVFPGNIASHLLFQKCGYQPQVNQIYISIPEED